ncbi:MULTISPECIES: NlpC/P60 family protein [Methylosinus]|uniref:NlpC/P60 domain-containing protein n=1 Tax=Methylosinus trichosporium (strain ATCC 35070 / NCIMB 11131 / UNIQEM 75 / OB3b) TaxID=595536 RepID=A0A2D2CYB2_METT3|nr:MULTISPECIES: NlpC/P60 family protein [Methylosinus]ATQ67728.1 hypothetical protein CQW49_07360 [Methylosinus trichosporium OB3b]OBS51164.1 hypothetical protein A8B73_17750 [Methylosinus sp. 3S-1]
MTHWSTDYIGLPWRAGGRTRDGVDCYGLARLVYAERLGIDLPGYDESYATAEEWVELAALIDGGLAAGPWREIALDEAREYDGLLFRRGGLATHIGLFVAPGLVLHASAGRASAIQRLERVPLALAKILRHSSRP